MQNGKLSVQLFKKNHKPYLKIDIQDETGLKYRLLKGSWPKIKNKLCLATMKKAIPSQNKMFQLILNLVNFFLCLSLFVCLSQNILKRKCKLSVLQTQTLQTAESFWTASVLKLHHSGRGIKIICQADFFQRITTCWRSSMQLLRQAICCNRCPLFITPDCLVWYFILNLDLTKLKKK